MEAIRPVGYIKTSKKGKTHIVETIRNEVGLEIGVPGEIPYFLDANCVLLARKGASLTDILKGLDILKEDLKLRATGKE